jgi:hypothetical protein
MALLERIFTPQKASLEPQKAVTGPGASVMSWGTPIGYVSNDPRQMIREALAVYARGNRWVMRAEMTISGRVGSVPWHLETDDGEEVTDESSPELRAIRDLFEKPLGDDFESQYGGQPRTRRELWGLTSRHMGLVNVGFWFLDEMNALTGWPKRIFYIRPDRMTPKEEGGRLVGWVLDEDGSGSGKQLSTEEVVPFYLVPPDKGYFGQGLVEAIATTLPMPNTIDRHAIDTLASGGRLPGIYAPKEVAGDDVFDRLQSDLRVIKDMPDSSKRDVVARMPMEFTPTAADMNSLSVVELSRMSRDDVLAHWGVPLSTIGGYTPAGMNSGETRKYDEAALWQNAVQFRIDSMYERIQYQMLDRLGMGLQLVVDVPTFDDETPKYELARIAESQPLKNIERRRILGLEPFGDPALDNAVWVPVSTVEIAQAPGDAEAPTTPEDEGTVVSRQQAEAVGVLIRAGFDPNDALRALGLPDIKHVGLLPITLQSDPANVEVVDEALGKARRLPAKAKTMNMDPLIERVRETSEDRLERDVAKVLDKMRTEISEKVAAKHDHLSRKPTDASVWWDEGRWRRELEKAIKPHISLAAETVGEKVTTALEGKS